MGNSTLILSVEKPLVRRLVPQMALFDAGSLESALVV